MLYFRVCYFRFSHIFFTAFMSRYFLEPHVLTFVVLVVSSHKEHIEVLFFLSFFNSVNGTMHLKRCHIFRCCCVFSDSIVSQ